MSRITAPFLNPYSFDEEERNEIRGLNSKLSSLIDYGEAFMDAVLLLEEVRKQGRRAELYSLKERRHQCTRWKAITGRDAVVTLFKIDETMHNVSKALNKIPRLLSNIDKDMHRKASKDFRREFPDNNSNRQAVVHSTDKVMNPKKLEQHSFKGSFDELDIRISHAQNLIISDVWSNKGFSSTWNGKVRTSPIDIEKATKLKSIVEEYIAAFNVGAEKIREEDMAIMRGSS